MPAATPAAAPAAAAEEIEAVRPTRHMPRRFLEV